ncbi:MAG: PepSY-associated TM helix domain-containing protein [Rhodopirellula sp. JB044]|uniref:PepSY-associated TM helix domain-containing protein n=1 Tax=Rhodopirellula sp. JB044 TaxID=3342844 RepID=UPI00370ADA08
MPDTTAETPEQTPSRRGKSASSWGRTLIAWHWISSAVSLVGMLLFAITGITLNHASQIETEPETRSILTELPSDLRAVLNQQEHDDEAALPGEVAQWLSSETSYSIGARKAEWSDDEVYLSMPGPGRDAWLAIDRESGEIEFEETRRGMISYLNDLHKGRNTGPAWRWTLDLFAIATLVFCITGLLLLIQHARRRRMTWPLVGLGFIAPFIVAVLLIH